MEQHPIKNFIDQLFQNKPEESRTKWANTFIKEEYDSTDELKQLSNEDWNNLTKSLPAKIKDAIRNNLKPKIEDQTTLSSKQIEKIIYWLNKDVKPQEIVDHLDAKLGTPRGDAIFERANTLIEPPKPYPQNAKRIDFRQKDEPVLPLFHYNGTYDPLRKYYTFLVIGQTGTGKTTLLDAFVNKLTGMNYIDNWRWKLVDESHFNQVDDGSSKTSEISIYYINDHQNKFNVRIIDTPGFGDTSGIKKDNEITEKFGLFFKELPDIDYILLTVKSTETRKLAGSKYVYDKVQQLFSLQTKDRFILMCTFADSKIPKCLSALSKDIVYDKYFKFNNSGIYTPSDKGDKLYWKMAIQSVQQFSQYVIASNRLPLSLNLSSEQLQVRSYLEVSIMTSQQLLNATWLELDNAKKSYRQLTENKENVEKNGQYTEIVTKTKYEIQPLNNTYQMCRICQVTCCQICVWPANLTQSRCSYFNSVDSCPKCPGRCPKSSHIRSNQKITKITYTEQVVVDLKKKFYDQSLSNAQRFTIQLQEKIDSICLSVERVRILSIDIKKSLNKLQNIALKPKLYSDKQFYEAMIQSERSTKQAGWSDRVNNLQSVLRRIEALGEIDKFTESNISADELFPELKELKKNYQSIQKQKDDSKCVIY